MNYSTEMSELANSPHCQQLNGQNLASFHNGKHTFQTLSAEPLEAEMPASASALGPNELMRDMELLFQTGLKRLTGSQHRRMENNQGLE